MIFSIGQRITARGENFIITDITENKDETYLLDSLGISELVRGKSFIFDTAIDKEIKPVDPTHTRLVAGADLVYECLVLQELPGLSHEFALFVLDVVATSGDINSLRRTPIFYLGQKDFAAIGEKYRYRPRAW